MIIFIKRKRGAFTLVELIVTITIVAILATIAFISYGFMVSEAKNSKIKDQMAQMWRNIEFKKTEGLHMLSFVNGKRFNQLPEPSIRWKKTIIWTNYQAGTINFTGLWMKKIENRPWKEYTIGVASLRNGRYEIAWLLNAENDIESVILIWNYRARKSIKTFLTGSLFGQSQKSFLTLKNNNNIFVGDVITSSWWSIVTRQVLKIKSTDNTNDTISTIDTLPLGTVQIMLAEGETPWLIMGQNSTSQTWVVIHKWEFIP